MSKLLLVDDSRVMRSLLRSSLLEAGFKDSDFLEASDGKEALAKLAEVGFQVDAVFCDLYMPNLDGLGLLDVLREHGVVDSCRVIVLTADGRKTLGREALLRGARALLRKPFTSAEVADALRKVLPVPEPRPR